MKKYDQDLGGNRIFPKAGTRSREYSVSLTQCPETVKHGTHSGAQFPGAQRIRKERITF